MLSTGAASVIIGGAGAAIGAATGVAPGLAAALPTGPTEGKVAGVVALGAAGGPKGTTGTTGAVAMGALVSGMEIADGWKLEGRFARAASRWARANVLAAMVLAGALPALSFGSCAPAGRTHSRGAPRGKSKANGRKIRLITEILT